LAGTTPAAGTAALIRGGSFVVGTFAGVFAVFGGALPSDSLNNVGFRGGR
jgi:hypothetical protein